MLDRKIFFDAIRRDPFGGSLSASQVQGIELVLDTWLEIGTGIREQLAYVLATDYHETDRKMQPIHEYKRGAGRPYGTVDVTGKAPYGRGLVQITWRKNYVKADEMLKLGGALAKDYDLALEPAIAVKILIEGMIVGLFTGRGLSDYIAAGDADYVNARRIVNGTDCAAKIAGYAEAFDAALLEASRASADTVAPRVYGTLRRGDQSADVLALQTGLAAAGFYKADLDGKFGRRTLTAVRALQKSSGLPVNGIAEQKTREALARIVAG